MNNHIKIRNLTTSVPMLDIRMNLRSPGFHSLIQLLYVTKDKQDRTNCRGIEKYGGLPTFI